jgi:hypothetical protein
MNAYGARNMYGIPTDPAKRNQYVRKSLGNSMTKKDYQPMPGQNPIHVTPEQIITRFLSDAQFNTDRVKNELHTLYGKHTEGELNDNKRRSEINRVRPYVHFAVEKSKDALKHVPGITLKDAAEIEEDIKTMEDVFKTEDMSMLHILHVKMAADRLQIMWEYYLEHLDMEKIEKNLGSYAMGQLYGSAKGGKRTHRKQRTNRKQRTHRNRKHKRTQRK